METLIRNALVDYMKENKLFSSQQYGFLNGRSTVLQLLKVLDRWTEILDHGGAVDIIYCDFMKAFDRVPHARLIDTLHHYSIEDPVLSWIEAFLKDRKQRVIVNGRNSNWYDVLSGIPQGSVLGPILFVIYINSLPSTVEHSEVYLFADDTKIFKGIFSDKDKYDLQSDLDQMQVWSEKSLLLFHPDKCVSMRVGKSDVEFGYTMGPNKQFLRTVTHGKDIGVIIDENLNFELHLTSKINKANQIMGLIRRTYEFIDEETFLLLFKALVRPHIEYANQVWAPHLKKHITEIENVQRRATKLIPGFKELTYEQRLRRLKLPTLAYRRLRGDMIEMFKIATGKYDADVSSFINPRTNALRGHQFKL